MNHQIYQLCEESFRKTITDYYQDLLKENLAFLAIMVILYEESALAKLCLGGTINKDLLPIWVDNLSKRHDPEFNPNCKLPFQDRIETPATKKLHELLDIIRREMIQYVYDCEFATIGILKALNRKIHDSLQFTLLVFHQDKDGIYHSESVGTEKETTIPFIIEKLKIASSE